MKFLSDLKQLKIQKKTVSIYTNKEDIDLFSCGYIAGIDNNYIFINHITSNGYEDGIIVRKLNDIYKIEYNGEYENRIEKLYLIRKQLHKDYLNCKRETSDSLLTILINNSQRYNLIMTFAIGDINNNIELTGKVKKINNKKIYITQISQFGQEVGESIILIDDICKASCDSQDEKDVLLLYENKE